MVDIKQGKTMYFPILGGAEKTNYGECHKAELHPRPTSPSPYQKLTQIRWRGLAVKLAPTFAFPENLISHSNNTTYEIWSHRWLGPAPVWAGIISLNVACIARPPASSRALAWDIYVFVSTNNIDLCFTHSDNPKMHSTLLNHITFLTLSRSLFYVI